MNAPQNRHTTRIVVNTAAIRAIFMQYRFTSQMNHNFLYLHFHFKTLWSFINDGQRFLYTIFFQSNLFVLSKQTQTKPWQDDFALTSLDAHFSLVQLDLKIRFGQILKKINTYSIRVHHIRQRRKRDREKES